VVRLFVELKAKLVWNGVRHDVQRRFGFPVATVLLGWLAFWLAGKHLSIATALSDISPEAMGHYLGWAALFLFLAWVTLPVIIFPLDENLDPQQLAVLPISLGQMVKGLTAASLVAPATLIPIILLTANATILINGWWMILPASIVYIGLLSVGSQLFSSAISSILRTRRGRDIATFLILGLAAGSFFLYRAVSQSVESLGIAQAALSAPILDWALLLPPVAAQRAIIEAADGNALISLIMLAAAVGGLAVFAIAWRNLLGWMLSTPQEGSRPAARSRRNGMTSGPWGVVPTLTRKELRFYVRDPRQRLVWTGTVIFVGLAVAGTIMGATGFFDLRDNEWAPLVAPILVMFVGLPIALNLFGWERNAASYLFVLPTRPSQLILGKNIAVSLGLFIESIILAVALSWFTGFWQWTWMVIPLVVAAIGSQLAVGNIVSVLTPLRLPREGTDVFAQSTEQGCLAIVMQVVSFFAIGLLLVPPASVVVLTVDFGRAVPPWFAAMFSILYGLILYLISLFVSSRLLKRRLPEVMSWVQVV
jgi:ABC-2 type transport system permease protein